MTFFSISKDFLCSLSAVWSSRSNSLELKGVALFDSANLFISRSELTTKNLLKSVCFEIIFLMVSSAFVPKGGKITENFFFWNVSPIKFKSGAPSKTRSTLVFFRLWKIKSRETRRYLAWGSLRLRGEEYPIKLFPSIK